MGGLLWLAQHWVPALNTDAHGLAQAALLAMLIAGAVAIYGLLLGLFGVIRRSDAVNAIRQTRPGDLRD